jgi:two-component system chemotaxis response regulator CheY
VDDVPDLAAPLARLLVQAGLVAVVLPCGELLLSHLRLQATPKLIILDLDMPGMDGFDCLRAIRDSLSWRDIPVVIYSSETDPQKREEAGRLGAQDYIVKGEINWPDLLAVLRGHGAA